MDTSSMPPVNMAARNASVVGTPPRLGTPIPGTTGGLPAQGGLSVLQNPMAQELQSMGRGQDTMLVHMTPQEVGGLQQLAMAAGGSLSINPHTGLPEAGFLGKILPTIAGFALNFIPTIGPLAAAAITAAGSTAATGDIRKGLLAGLGAWGGASLSGALLPTATATPVIGSTVGSSALNAGSEAVISQPTRFAATFPGAAVGQPAQIVGQQVGSQVTPSIFSQFANASRAGIPAGAPAFVSKAAPYAAGLGLFSNVSEAMQPNLPKYKPEENKSVYAGPYLPTRRIARMPEPGETPDFSGVNPYPGFVSASSLNEEERKPYGFANGGVASSGKGSAPSPTPSAPPSSGKGSAPTTPSAGISTGSPYASPYMSQMQMAPTPSQTQRVSRFVPGSVSTGPMYRSTPPASGKGAQPAPTPPVPGLGGFVDYYGGVSPRGIGSFSSPGSLSSVEGSYYSAPRSVYTTPQVSPTPPSPLMGYYGGYRHGGEVAMGDGSFVVDARTVSELGNGSSNAGKELLARMGGRPLDGPGDGVSDSIPARIGGHQEARVARDEVIMPPEAVRRIGGGSEKKGAKKLYALMDRAHAARKKAKRGQDTKLARGLGALV